MTARKAERVFECEFKDAASQHRVCLVETDDEPNIGDKEIAQFIWWDPNYLVG